MSREERESKSGEFVGSAYKERSAHQQKYNDENNRKLTLLIDRWCQGDTRKQGISICDLGCGHGQPTIDLYDKLVACDIPVNEMIGYDVSQSQITEASRLESRADLSFLVRDIQELQDKCRFDVIYSWFVLHWMDDLEKARDHILAALKPGGHFVFLAPLEKPTLWSIREKLVSSGKWRAKFSGYNFMPFKFYNTSYYAGELGYQDVFKEAAEQDYQHSTRAVGVRTFEEEEFSIFLKSWMQELRVESDGVRRLSEADQDEYARDIIREIKALTPTVDSDVKILSNGLIEFHEQYVFSVWQKPLALTLEHRLWRQEQVGTQEFEPSTHVNFIP